MDDAAASFLGGAGRAGSRLEIEAAQCSFLGVLGDGYLPKIMDQVFLREIGERGSAQESAGEEGVRILRTYWRGNGVWRRTRSSVRMAARR